MGGILTESQKPLSDNLRTFYNRNFNSMDPTFLDYVGILVKRTKSTPTIILIILKNLLPVE